MTKSVLIVAGCAVLVVLVGVFLGRVAALGERRHEEWRAEQHAQHEQQGDEPALDARDVDWERRWTMGASRAAGVHGDEFMRFAEARAGDGVVRDLGSRDFAEEVLEELADARNYLVWWAQQVSQRDGSVEMRLRLWACLAVVAAAWDQARRLADA